MVYRVFAEKKPGFDVEAAGLLKEFRSFLGIKSMERLRILNRYDVEDVPEELFGYARTTVFSEPQIDTVSSEADVSDADLVFAVEPLPGQYDQRADSAAQCIQLQSAGERPLVHSAKVYAVYGTLTEEDVKAVKRYVINPVDSREASMELPETLKQEISEPDSVETLT